MKKTTIYLSLLCTFICLGNVQAQLLFEENFNYTAENPLISNPVVSSTNTDATTGWSTISGTNSNTNSFNITTEGLTYPNYGSSGIGKALKVLDNNGQDVYKVFCGANLLPTPGAPYVGPKTIYLATLINVPAGDKTGFEYILGLKTDLATASTHVVRGRLSVKVTGDNVQFGVSKSVVFSAVSPLSVWTNNYSVNTTYLLVIKYTMTGAAASLAEETGNYDDIVDLYVNPTIGASEPSTSTLRYAVASETDAYRWNSGGTSIIGGMAGVCFRTPTAGSIPEATFDGIRVGETWESVATSTVSPSGLRKTTADYFSYSINANKQITISAKATDYTNYEFLSLAGQRVLAGSLTTNTINAASLKSGVYLLKLIGTQTAAAKIIIR